MNLRKKKMLASKTLAVGESRIVFLGSRIDEIKDAITRQDIRDLYGSGAILIKEISGRKKVTKEKSRSAGNIRKKILNRKRKYVITTRKLRKHLNEVGRKNGMGSEQMANTRELIKRKEFKNKSGFNDFLKTLKNKK